MTRVLKFTHFGDLPGKARARVTKNGTFTPKKTKDAERALGWAAIAACHGEFFIGPVAVTIRVFVQHSKASGKRGDVWIIGKPDCDNQIKLACDAFNNVLWMDDAQVSRVSFERRYGAPARVEFEIEELSHDTAASGH